MPANYAFHRFGADALRLLPSQMQGTIQRFRRLYNGGLHGHDLFFYFKPMSDTPTGALRGTFDAMTGREFFEKSAQWLKQNPSEGGTACLYGLLAHYCLKSELASLFASEIKAGKVNRTELEVELDRYLLGLDGKTPAHTQDISEYFKMTRGECVTLSGFFPPATPANVVSALKQMTTWTRRLAAPKRRLAKLLLKLTRGEFSSQMMPDHANHKCMHLDGAMLECYHSALEKYPDMAKRLALHCKNGAPLGEEFELPYA